MATKKIESPLNKDKVLKLLESKNLSLRKLDKDCSFNWSSKSISRGFKTGASISLVKDLAEYLNVDIKDIT